MFFRELHDVICFEGAGEVFLEAFLVTLDGFLDQKIYCIVFGELASVAVQAVIKPFQSH